MFHEFFGSSLSNRMSLVFGEAPPDVWLAKLIGAIAGSLISIAYVLPRGRREALLRLIVGIVTGVIFGGVGGVKLADMLGLLGKFSATETALMGAALVSLSAWWGLGVLQRFAERQPFGSNKRLIVEKQQEHGRNGNEHNNA